MDLFYIEQTGGMAIDVTGGYPLTDPIVLMRHRVEEINFYIVQRRSAGVKSSYKQLKPLSGELLNWKLCIRERSNFDGAPLFEINETVESTHIKWSREKEAYAITFCLAGAALNKALGRSNGTNDGTPIDSVVGDSTTDTLTSASHGYGEGDIVKFTSLLGGDGLTPETHYFIRNPATDTFQLSLAVDDAVINFTANVISGTIIMVEAGGEDKASLECAMQIAWSRVSGDSGTWEGTPTIAVNLLNNVADIPA